MFVAKLPGIDVGDAGDERRPEERQDAKAGPVERLVDRAQPGGQLHLEQLCLPSRKFSRD